jgi:hypothetical protein
MKTHPAVNAEAVAATEAAVADEAEVVVPVIVTMNSR